MAIYAEFAKRFYEIAKRDLAKAKREYKEGDYPEAVFHAQQCVEKAAKAMIEVRRKYVFNHGPAVISVFEECFKDEWRREFDCIVEALDYLQGLYTATRYPKLVGDKVLAPWEIIDERIARKALRYAEEVLRVAGKYLVEKGIIPREEV